MVNIKILTGVGRFGITEHGGAIPSYNWIECNFFSLSKKFMQLDTSEDSTKRQKKCLSSFKHLAQEIYIR